jgi:hypothetical protein
MTTVVRAERGSEPAVGTARPGARSALDMSPRVVLGVLLLAIAALAFAPARLTQAWAVNARDQNQDFGVFYRSAHCLFTAGCDPYAVVEGSAPNLVPPHAHLLIAPVILLERQTAYALWLQISLVSIVAAALRVSRELSLRPSLPMWLLAAALAVSSGMTMSLVTSGQIYAVLAWPVTAGWVAWRHGELTRAARWLAVAASIKLLLALALLWFVVRGRWRAALAMAATTAVIFGIGAFVFGSEAYRGWLEMLSRAPMAGHFRDGALMATLIRLCGESASFAAVVDAAWLIRPAWAVLAGIVVAVGLLAPRDRDRACLALLASAALSAPIGWIYSAWWFLGPAAAVWISGTALVRSCVTVAAVILWLPDTVATWGQPNPVMTLGFGSLATGVWLCFWTAAVAKDRRRLPRPAG